MKQFILFLSLASMTATLMGQHHAIQGPLTAQQVKQQSLTRMINDEIQRRQQQASPEQYQQIAQQVSRQYSLFMNDASQLDPRHTLPAMAAQAIEQKLDSIINCESGYKYIFKYDTDRLLMLNATQYALIDGQWVFQGSTDYEYDTQNRIINRDENYTNYDTHYEITYNSWGTCARVKHYTLEHNDQHIIIGGYGSDCVYNSQGFVERETRLAYNPAVGLYEDSATEYEYFNVPSGEIPSDYICKTTKYYCPNGSFTLEPYSREEWQEDRLRGKEENYVDGRWHTTYLSTMDDFGITRTEEWYVIENGSARLSRKNIETRCGWSGFQNMQTRCRTDQWFDPYGNVTSGSKEDHLYDLEIDYYRWNTSTRDWEIDYIEYPDGEPYEGKTRSFMETPIISGFSQIYQNGQWETTNVWGIIEAEPVVPYGNPGFYLGNYRTLHELSYTIDTNTGNYLYYSEYFHKYENGQLVSSDTYDMPNSALPTYRREYDYTTMGAYSEIRYFNSQTGSLELQSREVYDYDPSITTRQVLNPENVNVNSMSMDYYYYNAPLPNATFGAPHPKPLSVKRYDAAGNFMEDLTLYYYSSLHGDTDEGLPEITPDDPNGDLNPFLNLMGQPLAHPQPGQPMIDVRHSQVIVR